MLLGGLNSNASLELMDQVYTVTMEQSMGK